MKKKYIIIPLIIALIAFVLAYRYYNKEDAKTTLTINEKHWVEENVDKTIVSYLILSRILKRL